MAFNYLLFGEMIRSELPLGNTIATTEHHAHPITLNFGPVTKEGIPNPSIKGVCYQATSTSYWLNIPSVARFLINNGNSIIIDPAPNADEDTLRAFFFNVCLEWLLKQRHLTIVPGFSVNLHGTGVLFTGHLGLVQSLLQGILYQRGYSFLSGNFSVLSNQNTLLPGIPHLELGTLVTSRLQMDINTLKPLRSGIKKFLIPLDEHYQSTPLTLKTIYTLKLHSQDTISFSEGQHSKFVNCQAFNEVEIFLSTHSLNEHHLADCIINDVTKRGNYVTN